MKKYWLEKILDYPLNEALYNFETKIIWSDKLYQLNYDEGVFFANGINSATKKVAEVIVTDDNFDDEICKNEDILFRSYTYFFDKGVELAYNLRVDNGKTTNFYLDDLINGMGGNDIPEYIQLKVSGILGKLTQIFRKVISFVNENEEVIYTCDISIKELMQCIIMSSAKLGCEFCLQLDLNDQSEMERHLKM